MSNNWPAWPVWIRRDTWWARLRGRFPKLGMIWCIVRGHTVAYRLRIENGGIVLDGARQAMVVECEIIRSPGAAITVDMGGTARHAPGGP